MCITSLRPYFSNQGSASSAASTCTNTMLASAAAISSFTAATSASASRQKVQPNDRRKMTSVSFESSIGRFTGFPSGGGGFLHRPLFELARVLVELANAVGKLLHRHRIEVVHEAVGFFIE